MMVALKGLTCCYHLSLELLILHVLTLLWVPLHTKASMILVEGGGARLDY